MVLNEVQAKQSEAATTRAQAGNVAFSQTNISMSAVEDLQQKLLIFTNQEKASFGRQPCLEGGEAPTPIKVGRPVVDGPSEAVVKQVSIIVLSADGRKANSEQALQKTTSSVLSRKRGLNSNICKIGIVNHVNRPTLPSP